MINLRGDLQLSVYHSSILRYGYCSFDFHLFLPEANQNACYCGFVASDLLCFVFCILTGLTMSKYFAERTSSMASENLRISPFNFPA